MFSLLDHKHNLYFLDNYLSIVPAFSTERKSDFTTVEVFRLRLMPKHPGLCQVDVSPPFLEADLDSVMGWLQCRIHNKLQINIPEFVKEYPEYVYSESVPN